MIRAIVQTALQAASEKQGQGGKLNKEAVGAIFAKWWNDDITLEVIAKDCPPEVSAIVMRRVKELRKKRPWYRRF